MLLSNFRPLAAVFAAVIIALAGVACNEEEPMVTSVEPTFAPADSLVIVQGEHLEDVLEMRFDGELVNFNTAFNTDQALLFRVPRNLNPNDYTVTLETDGGMTSFPFRVSEAAPRIFEVLEDQAALGEVITIVGENFYGPPLEVYFSGGVDEADRPLDSIPGEIVSASLDTIRARVPDEARAGTVILVANGGIARSPRSIGILSPLLITDFDGGGIRGDISAYLPRAVTGLDQNRRDITTFVAAHDSPAPLNGQYLKLSGRRTSDPLLGGIRIPALGDPFGISGVPLNTVITFDVHNGGRTESFLQVVLTDTNRVDYELDTRGILLEETGWNFRSIPLSRFTNLQGAPVSPGSVRGVSFFLFDDSPEAVLMEANIDNVRFAEVL